MAQAVPETASAGAMPPAAAHVEVVLVDSGGPTSASCHQLGDEQQPQQQQQQDPQQPTPDREPASAPPPPPPPPPAERLHHLTRHVLPEESRGGAAVAALGAPDPRAAELLVRSMGQRDLRRNFQLVYGSPTSSFNNAWLRRKLCEAVGVACAAGKKARKPRREAPPAAVQHRAQMKEARQVAAAAAEASAAETLAEIAAGLPVAGQGGAQAGGG